MTEFEKIQGLAVGVAIDEAELPIHFGDLAEFEKFSEYKLSDIVAKRSSEKEDRSCVNSIQDSHKLKDVEQLLHVEEDVDDFKILDSLRAVDEPVVRKVGEKWVNDAYLGLASFEKIRGNLALQYPFELDTFQKESVCRLERHENVFVAAHTSAGKTVVAEYGIALALKNKTRAIYTSPIKALSNQKFRDFKIKFGADNVGIITGDVSVNPEASCLIMTTEIFRSMLYKGSDTVRDIEYVIFDEVHYVNDAERGVVWEEVIIMLPDHVNLIFLSATTSNAPEFSDWIGRTKRKTTHLIYTNMRPVPLHHYLLYDNEITKLMEQNTYFPGALKNAVNQAEQRKKPKPQSSENAKFAAQRQSEKLAVASRNAGRNMSGREQGGRGGRGRGDGRGGGRDGRGGGSKNGGSGAKAQWIGLIEVLKAGGREISATGGDISFFGVQRDHRVLTEKARAEKKSLGTYEELPAKMRESMTKAEWVNMEVRDEDELEKGGEETGLLPVVIFSFSKKQCEEIADFLKSRDLLNRHEKQRVATMVQEVKSRLSPADAQLPQVHRVMEMLARGIGVHHGGLLPILKELVEMLFAESAVKVLFATETFAMGVNMPARAVVFNGFRKHDGRSFRDLLPGEYTQMAGRAGRRGLDTAGTVIIAAWTDPPEEQQLKTLMTGVPTKLLSKFRLRYNMILNLVRMSNLSVEDMMKRSFTEYATQKLLTDHDLSTKRKRYKCLLEYFEQVMTADDENIYGPELRKYKDVYSLAQNLTKQLVCGKKNSNKQDHLRNVFRPGRLINLFDVKIGSPSIGIVLKDPASTQEGVQSSVVTSDFQKSRSILLGGGSNEDIDPAIWVLTCKPLDSDDTEHVEWDVAPKDELIDLKKTFSGSRLISKNHSCWILKVPVSSVGAVFDHLAFKSSEAPLSIQDALATLRQTSLNQFSLKLFDFAKEFKNQEVEFVESQRRLVFEFKSLDYYCKFIPRLSDRYRLVHKIERTREKLGIIDHLVSDKQMSLFPDFKQRLGILGILGYVENDGQMITLKGRVACELNTCDELLATEVLFNNLLEPLNPPEAAAMLSALVFQEKNQLNDALTSRMETAKTSMQEILKDLTALQEIENVLVDNDLKPTLNFGLCTVVYQWARGTSFNEICNSTEFQEGSIVRAVTRLDELCKDFQNAAVVIGNPSLYRKMEAASACIKRDIVFAASLYLT